MTFKQLRLFAFLIFFSLVLFFLDSRGFLDGVRSLVERPILTVEKKIYSLISSRTPDEEDPFSLEDKLRQLAVEQNQLSSCLEENEQMRRLLGSPLPPTWKFLPAQVVGVTDKMRLDQGKKEGVEKGMIVVSEDVLVGRVVDITRWSSVIQMPLTPGTKIPVVVKQPGRNFDPGSGGVQARGLLVSQGDQLFLERVLQEEDIQEGDLVVTSGEADWLPDLLIGQIEEVLPKTVEIFQKARVKSLIDYQKLRIVFIVIKS